MRALLALAYSQRAGSSGEEHGTSACCPCSVSAMPRRSKDAKPQGNLPHSLSHTATVPSTHYSNNPPRLHHARANTLSVRPSEHCVCATHSDVCESVAVGDGERTKTVPYMHTYNVARRQGCSERQRVCVHVNGVHVVWCVVCGVYLFGRKCTYVFV